jgi:hypothetical protein
MKRNIIIGAIVAVALIVGGAWLAWPNAGGRDAIIKMGQRGASEAEMLKAVDGSRASPLSADDVVKLKAAGIPSAVIIKMLHNGASKSTVSGS